MTAVLVQYPNRSLSQDEQEQPAAKHNRHGVVRLRVVEQPVVADAGAAAPAVEVQEAQAQVSRHIDWYAKNRGLSPQIVSFLYIHWRSYLVESYLVDGEDSPRWQEGIKVMKDLAWSVRPKKDPISRRQLIELIPDLYTRLHVGLESLGFGSGATEHDRFFAELTALHQAALNPQVPIA